MSSRELAQLQLQALVSERADFFPITADLYQSMIENGTIPEGSPYELLGGHIVRIDRSEGEDDPMTHGLTHVAIIKRLARLGPEFKKLGCHLQAQLPILLSDDNVPEPDAAVVQGDEDLYLKRFPSAADISCVIEVSDRSLRHDRGNKLLMYAASGIPCYIIVNIAERLIEVRTQPRSGVEHVAPHYSQMLQLQSGDVLAIPTPGGGHVEIAVSALLP